MGEKRVSSPAAEDGTKIWVDLPVQDLAFGFNRIAAGLAKIIEDSEPCFAMGIYGGWGSGKTTIMNAIKATLEARPDIICIEFNAWRFERELSLLVPLLDTIRGGLNKWAGPPDEQAGGAKANVADAAKGIARIVRGLATGLSVEVGVPGAIKLGYDLDKGMNAISPDRSDDKPQSLYVAAFHELTAATEKFNNDIRVVVFVDDLDRCLPDNMLEMLESMKLFFDIRGFIFVAGVDERIVRQAVGDRLRLRSEPGNTASGPSAGGADSGTADGLLELERDYLDKIIQIAYRLPGTTTNELDKLLISMYDGDSAKAGKVSGYLRHVAVGGRISPRTVRRFLNSYTIQMRTGKDPKREIILALLVFSFRYEWLYDRIRIDWRLFKEVLSQWIAGDKDAFEDISMDRKVLSADLRRYLRSDEVKILAARDTDLESVLSSMDVGSADIPGLDEAYHGLSLLIGEARRVYRADSLKDADRAALIKIAAEYSAAMSSYPNPKGSFETLSGQLAESVEKLLNLQSLDAPYDGDPENAPRTVLKDVAESILSTSSEIRDELLHAAPAPPATVPPTTAPAETTLDTTAPGDSDREEYAERVMAVVRAALPEGWRLGPELRAPNGHRFDGLITSGPVNIAVETFHNRSFSGGVVSRAINGARLSRQPSTDAALIVARSRNATGFGRLEGDLTAWGLPHRVVEWQPEWQDDQVLAQAVGELIRELDS